MEPEENLQNSTTKHFNDYLKGKNALSESFIKRNLDAIKKKQINKNKSIYKFQQYRQNIKDNLLKNSTLTNSKTPAFSYFTPIDYQAEKIADKQIISFPNLREIISNSNNNININSLSMETPQQQSISSKYKDNKKKIISHFYNNKGNSLKTFKNPFSLFSLQQKKNELNIPNNNDNNPNITNKNSNNDYQIQKFKFTEQDKLSTFEMVDNKNIISVIEKNQENNIDISLSSKKVKNNSFFSENFNQSKDSNKSLLNRFSPSIENINIINSPNSKIKLNYKLEDEENQKDIEINQFISNENKKINENLSKFKNILGEKFNKQITSKSAENNCLDKKFTKEEKLFKFVKTFTKTKELNKNPTSETQKTRNLEFSLSDDSDGSKDSEDSPNKSGCKISYSNKFLPKNTKIKYYDNRQITRNVKVYDSLSDDEFELNSNDIFFHPNSFVLIILDFFILCSILFSLFIIPMRLIFFDSTNKLSLLIEIVIDSLMALDFLLNFVTGFYDFEENYNKKFLSIILNYIRTYFLTDLVSLIPFNSIIEYNQLNSKNNIFKFYDFTFETSNLFVTNNLNLFRILKILRLFKIPKIINENKFFHFFKIVFFADYSLPFVFKFMFYYLYFIILTHILSCVFIFLGTLSIPNWIIHSNLNDLKFGELYIASVYFNHLTIFTIGYGDIVTQNNYERVYNMLLMVFGVMLYSFVLSYTSNLIVQNNEKSKKFDSKKNYLNQLSLKYTIPSGLFNKIAIHLRHEVRNYKPDRNELLSALPFTLKNDLIFHINKRIINSFNFLKHWNNTDFIIQVVMNLRPTKYFRHELLLKEGDLIEEVVMVKNGILSMEKWIKIILPNELGNSSFFLPDQELLTLKILNLRKNEHFGDSLMIQNRRSPISLRVKSQYSELLLMNKIELIKISNKFPEIYGKIFENSDFNVNQIFKTIENTESFLRINSIDTRKKFAGKKSRIFVKQEMGIPLDYNNSESSDDKKKFDRITKNNNLSIDFVYNRESGINKKTNSELNNSIEKKETLNLKNSKIKNKENVNFIRNRNTITEESEINETSNSCIDRTKRENIDVINLDFNNHSESHRRRSNINNSLSINLKNSLSYENTNNISEEIKIPSEKNNFDIIKIHDNKINLNIEENENNIFTKNSHNEIDDFENIYNIKKNHKLDFYILPDKVLDVEFINDELEEDEYIQISNKEITSIFPDNLSPKNNLEYKNYFSSRNNNSIENNSHYTDDCKINYNKNLQPNNININIQKNINNNYYNNIPEKLFIPLNYEKNNKNFNYFYKENYFCQKCHCELEEQKKFYEKEFLEFLAFKENLKKSLYANKNFIIENVNNIEINSLNNTKSEYLIDNQKHSEFNQFEEYLLQEKNSIKNFIQKIEDEDIKIKKCSSEKLNLFKEEKKKKTITFNLSLDNNKNTKNFPLERKNTKKIDKNNINTSNIENILLNKSNSQNINITKDKKNISEGLIRVPTRKILEKKSISKEIKEIIKNSEKISLSDCNEKEEVKFILDNQSNDLKSIINNKRKKINTNKSKKINETDESYFKKTERANNVIEINDNNTNNSNKIIIDDFTSTFVRRNSFEKKFFKNNNSESINLDKISSPDKSNKNLIFSEIKNLDKDKIDLKKITPQKNKFHSLKHKNNSKIEDIVNNNYRVKSMVRKTDSKDSQDNVLNFNRSSKTCFLKKKSTKYKTKNSSENKNSGRNIYVMQENILGRLTKILKYIEGFK